MLYPLTGAGIIPTPMMRRFDLRQDSEQQVRQALLQAVALPSPELEAQVREIAHQVQIEGDTALLRLSRQWDCPTLESLEVTQEEFERAYEQVRPEVVEAIRHAMARVRRYHKSMRQSSWWNPEPSGGLLGQMVRPLSRVGVYVPGGRARYPSSVIMNAVPAKVAGVSEIVLCSPAQADGTLPASVLVAVREIGIQRVFKVGGAQAIFAMAFGTQSIPPVEKVVGPGNLYVNLAKRMVWGLVGVDHWAGPSEVAIVADDTANPLYIASDLLTQLEHGAESVGYLFSPSQHIIERTLQEIERSLQERARRETLERSLNQSVVVITRDLPEAFELANLCAPEHLSLMVAEPMAWLSFVRNAGCILLGNDTPQSAGDYVAGPRHTLPTGRSARFESPLSVETFLKRSSIIMLTRNSLSQVAPDILALAEEEGFEAHAHAVKVRLDS